MTQDTFVGQVEVFWIAVMAQHRNL